jgi:hypothetical protein
MEKFSFPIEEFERELKLDSGTRKFLYLIQEHLPILQKLSEQLQEAASLGDLEHLADLISQRQLLFERWRQLERSRITTQNRVFPAPSEEILTALKKLVTREQTLITLISGWREALYERLKALGTGQQLLKGYGAAESPRPRFVDVRD